MLKPFVESGLMMTKKTIIAFCIGSLFFISFFMPITYSFMLITVISVILFSTEIIMPVYSSIIIIIMLFIHAPVDQQAFSLSGFQSPVIFFNYCIWFRSYCFEVRAWKMVYVKI
jgi:hypothetical protein